MNFFESQDAARRKTSWLVLLYVAAVVLIVISVYFAFVGAALVVQGFARENRDVYSYTSGFSAFDLFWNEQTFIAVSAITLAIVLLGTLFKMIVISRGGAAVAQMLGGRPLSPDTNDPAERRLLNVVEEMAIASGIPAPPVYLLDDEQAINAFAAGFSSADAVIGVTRGCMQLLNRDEMQGVIAHEFSHIFNGDMRLNIRLMAVLHGILVIAQIGYLLVRSCTQTARRTYARDRGGDPRGFLIVLGIFLIIIGSVGVLFGKLIKSAVSRQREYLADASAVQFTRNPSGIAGALKKIGGFIAGSRLETPRAEEASHMYFANGLRLSFMQLMATHPPLADRIKRIDPSFTGEFKQVYPEAGGQMAEASTAGAFAGQAGGQARFAARPGEIVEAVGSLKPEHLDHARQILALIPHGLRGKCREPYGARAVVFALLINNEQEIETEQLNYLSKTLDGPALQETLRILGDLRALPAQCRLALVELTLPALKRLSQIQYTEFASVVDALIDADKRCSLFEYSLRRMFARHLDPTARQSSLARVKYKSLAPVADSAVLLLSTLSHAGAQSAEQAAQAFASGCEILFPQRTVSLLPPGDCSLRKVDDALRELLFATPAVKQQLIMACSACVITDGQITVDEAELLRAAADSLECPLPPFLSVG